MLKEDIEKRIQELTQFIEQSAANHNALLGRLNEAQNLLSMIEKAVVDTAEVVSVAEEVVSAL